MIARFFVKPQGTVQYLYNELLDLDGLGRVRIARGSWVEPDGEGRWWVKFPEGEGEAELGPFRRRSEALEAERAVLESRLAQNGGGG